tara:strand:+ start:9644 stop:9973 length:330 start_codon:yes stop_codon:yes gene_type:complete
MATFQSIIDSTRVFLQDDAKTRYTDAQLLDYANEAIGISRSLRPDFFLGSLKTALATYTLTDDVPIPLEYQSYLKDYIMGRAEFRDDEYSQDGRVGSLLARYKQGLIAK